MSTFILATGGYDTAVRFLDASNQAIIRTLRFSDQHVIRLAFSGEGPVAADDPLYIAVAGSPTICVYDVSTDDPSPTRASPFAPYTGHSEAVTAVGFEPKHNAFVYSASEDGTLQTWLPELAPAQAPQQQQGQQQQGQQQQGQQQPGGAPPYQVHGHESHYPSSTANGTIGEYQPSAAPFTPAKFLNDGPNGLVAIHDATYYPPLELFFTADALGRLRVWDHRVGSLRLELIPHRKRRNLQCLELSSDYKTLVVANFDGYVFVYDTERLLQDHATYRPASFRAHNTYITRLRLSVSGNILVCTTRSSLTKVFRMADIIGSNSTSSTDPSSTDVNVTPTLEFPGEPGWVWDAAFVGDGDEYLFTCSSNTHVMLWALNDMRRSTRYSGHNKAVVCLAVKERINASVPADQFGLNQEAADNSRLPSNSHLLPFRYCADDDDDEDDAGPPGTNINGGTMASA